jgi:CheY-like chemotaxis protein
VEDTGLGIAPEELELLFSAFSQTSSGKKSQVGTGLGLTISRAFVQMMGGDISVQSQPGLGSCFKFDIKVLPLLEMGTTPVPHGRQPRALGLRPNQAAPDGGPYRMLVAEDVQANWLLMENLLRALGRPFDRPEAASGFDVRLARNGREAIQIWQAWRPHLIWMDIRMPVMNGSEATRIIKAQPGGSETTIIALTATAFEEDRLQALSDGFDGFVRKPAREKYIVGMLVKKLGIQFVYETKDLPLVEHQVASSLSGIEDAEDYSEISDAWLSNMQQALVQGDIQMLRNLAAQIQSHAPALSHHVTRLTDNFALDELSQLIQSITTCNSQN